MVKLLTIFNESIVSDVAKRKGYKYIGFGRWVNPNNDELFTSTGNDLKKFVRKNDRIKYFNTVDSPLDNSDFYDIVALMNRGKIDYKENGFDDELSIKKFFGDKGLMAPDFIFSFIPKRLYEDSNVLNVEINLDGRDMLFKAKNDREYNAEYRITKVGNSYVLDIVNLQFPEYIDGSKTMRDLMYNISNFCNRMGITEIRMICGLVNGSYMWSRYGVNFKNADERSRIKKEISEKASQLLEAFSDDERLKKVFREVYKKIVHGRHSWDFAKIGIKMEGEYIKAINAKVNMKHYTDDKVIKVGKYLMSNLIWNGKLALYPDTPEYKQFYKYMNFTGKKYSKLNESFLLLEEAGQVVGTVSPYHITFKKMTDEKIWNQDKYDISYEKEMLELIDGK